MNVLVCSSNKFCRGRAVLSRLVFPPAFSGALRLLFLLAFVLGFQRPSWLSWLSCCPFPRFPRFLPGIFLGPVSLLALAAVVSRLVKASTLPLIFSFPPRPPRSHQLCVANCCLATCGRGPLASIRSIDLPSFARTRRRRRFASGSRPSPFRISIAGWCPSPSEKRRFPREPANARRGIRVQVRWLLAARQNFITHTTLPFEEPFFLICTVRHYTGRDYTWQSRLSWCAKVLGRGGEAMSALPSAPASANRRLRPHRTPESTAQPPRARRSRRRGARPSLMKKLKSNMDTACSKPPRACLRASTWRAQPLVSLVEDSTLKELGALNRYRVKQSEDAKKESVLAMTGGRRVPRRIGREPAAAEKEREEKRQAEDKEKAKSVLVGWQKKEQRARRR